MNAHRDVPMAQRLNRYLFIKNGYSPCKHVVPVAIAALLLLTLSVPTENLLLQLADLLERRSWRWLPAAFLTLAATTVYFFTVRLQVRKGHLFADRDLVRTIITSLIWVAACALMAFLVLHSATPQLSMLADATFGNIWACLLIAVLSLTGVGWSEPGAWVEAMGVKTPDYEKGRDSAEELTRVLGRVRKEADAQPKDADDFLAAAEGLHESVRANAVVEPGWARLDTSRVEGALETLIRETKDKYATGDAVATSDFVAACRCEERGRHGAFIGALETLGEYWNSWRCT